MELGKDLRTGGSPIDVRGEALDIVRDMNIFDQIKDSEFVHTDEVLDAHDQTLATFAINSLPEYLGDIEIHRGDLVKIMYEIIPKNEVEVIFGDSISSLIQHDNRIEVSFEKGKPQVYDFAFGAEGIHSIVRKLIFGAEEDFKKFLGVYFAFANVDQIQTGRTKSTGIVYRYGN